MTNLLLAIATEITTNTEHMTYDEAKHWIENDAYCETGAVGGLIYYSETTDFFDKFEDEILELAAEHELDYSPIKLGMAGFKNRLVWFTFEILKQQAFDKYFDADSFTKAA